MDYVDGMIGFNAEDELETSGSEEENLENKIFDLFLKLPKDRQRAVLGELWSEHKPEKPERLRNFNNLPY